MDPTGSVTRLANDLTSEDDRVRGEAARQIWARYCDRLLELARRHLARRVRAREDEEDVVQSMFNSFCRRHQRGDFEIAGRDALWGLMVTITLQKARNAANRHLCQRRDIRRERPPAIGPEGAGTAFPDWALEHMQACEPGPAEGAALCEELELRLADLSDPEDPLLQQVAVLKLEGYTNEEIAARLKCAGRTVERKLQRIRARWEPAQGERS